MGDKDTVDTGEARETMIHRKIWDEDMTRETEEAI